jgi:hypothetical protein
MKNFKLTKPYWSFDCAEDGKETLNEETPENNSQFTTVYVGNLAPEVHYPLGSAPCNTITTKTVYLRFFDEVLH